MEETAYLALAQTEEQGWYYQARRSAVLRLFEAFAPARRLRILDLGCGTAGSTQAWSAYGEVLGVEPSPLARKLAAQRFPHLPIKACGWEGLDAAEIGFFDVAVVLCVLYHRQVTEPLLALQKLASLQKPGALLIWNEPAYAYLWRQHDRQTAAGRRFHPRQMQELLAAAGYELVFKSHLLAWAYPIALVLALIDRWRWGADRATTTPEEGSDHRPVHPWINAALRSLTRLEWSLNFYGLGLPFGLSCLMVARKKDGPASGLLTSK